MKKYIFSSLCIAACAFILRRSPQAQTPALQKIHVLTLSGRPPQFVVADSQGLFAKYGIQLESEYKKTSDELRAEFATGQGDIAYLSVDNAVAMVELAHQDVVIVMGGDTSQNELIAQPDVKSVRDLRGKILIVDAPNTAYALQMKKLFLMNGMTAGKDYEIKPLATTPQRLVAMRDHKKFAGSILGPPVSLAAKHEGFVSLGSVQDFIGPYQAAGFFAQCAWIKDHRELLVSFLEACVEAQRWLLDPANKQQVIQMLTSEYHLAPEIADEYYQTSFNGHGGYAKDAQFDLRGFENVLKLRAEVEGQWGGHPPAADRYYDPTYYTAALSKVNHTP